MLNKLLLTSILLVSTSAFATDECANPESQAEINACAVEKLDAAEKSLKKTIASLIAEGAQKKIESTPEIEMVFDTIKELEKTSRQHFVATCLLSLEDATGSLAPTETALCATEKLNELTENFKTRVHKLYYQNK